MNDLVHEKAYFSHKDRLLTCLLALQEIDGMGPINQRRFLIPWIERIAGSPQSEGADQLEQAIRELLKEGRPDERFTAARREIELCRERGVGLLPYWSEDYPVLLRECTDAPLLIWTTGVPDWNNRPVISVVGTRNMTHYGRGFCSDLIEVIRPFRPIVVSGFAKGVDIEAQLRALDAGLESVAVLAHGLGCTYPPEHRRHRQPLTRQGALISEFRYDVRPQRMHFVRRNRIIAGISCATIVVESNLKGGSLSTAGLALDYNREVLAVPGRYTDRYSTGCNRLIQQQSAMIISDPGDIPDLLGWEGKFPVYDSERKISDERTKIQDDPAADPEESLILKSLDAEGPSSINGLAVRLGLGSGQLSGLLLRMELRGIIRKASGHLYERA